MPEVDPKRKKSLQEVLDRMERGFDENMLDPLLESIYKEDEKGEPDPLPLPSESKVKPKKVKFKVIKVAPSAQGDSLAGFLGGKIGETFSMASAARAADPNKIKRDPGFYLAQAAKFQFGGDLINRTKGTFSSDPTDVQDPALGRSGRFSAQVNPYFEMQQGPLPAPESENDGGIGKAFSILTGKFDDLIRSKQNKEEQLELAFDVEQETTEDVKSHIKESNTIKKKAVEIQKKFFRFNAAQKDQQQVEAIETPSEEVVDNTSLLKYDNERDEDETSEDDQEKPGLLDTALDFLSGDDFLRQGGKAAGRVGRRGAGRVLTRTALRLGGKKLAKTAAVRVTQSFIKKAALGLMRPIIKRIPIFGGLIDFAVSLMLGEPVGRAAAKAVGSTLGAALGTLIPIPFVGTVAGGILGDMVGGFLYDALTGGAPKDPTNSTPEVKEAAGAPSSFADQSGGLGSIDPSPEKLASGGFLAGEAGPEAVFSLSSTTGRKVVKQVSQVSAGGLSAIPFILGITKKIIEQVGGEKVKPFIKQEIGPLERLFGISSFNVQGVVGDGAEGIQSEAAVADQQLKQSGGVGGVDPQETMNGQQVAGAGGPIPGINMGGGEGKTSAGAVYKYLLSKGIPEVHAKGLVVNIMRESGFKIGAHGDRGIGGSFGLFQWNMAAGRGGPMMAAVPNWQSNWKGQIDYALQEHRGPEYLRTQFSSPGEAAYWWMKYWEIPAASIQAKYTPAVYEGMINKMGLSADMPDMAPPPGSPPGQPAAAADDNGGHTAETPGPVGTQPPEAPDQQNQEVMTPPSPEQMVPLPKNLQKMQENDQFGSVTFQPIIIQGSSTPVGYRKNMDMGSDAGVAHFYYDRQGNTTTLDALKRARLQVN